MLVAVISPIFARMSVSWTPHPKAEDFTMIPKTYVVPLDGSPFAERAIPVAAALAERMGGRVLLLSAPHHGPLVPSEYLAEIAARSTTVPVDTLSNVAHLPADAIATVVGESDDRIVCMTSHGRGGLRWSVLGSTAEEVVRRTDRPVLLVGQHCRDDFLTRGAHLLAAIDTAANATHLAPVAREWAQQLGLQTDAAVVVHPLDVESYEHPEPLLDPIVEEFGGAGNVRATMLSSTYVAGALADYAGDLPAALVAMNTAGRTGLARVALGSVTMAVLHLSNCPLLVTHDTETA
jgi:nucleotide-binding universal stress UspA family protein